MVNCRACCHLLAGILIAAPLVASGAEIRFYKLNSKGQQNEIFFMLHGDDPGCHNFPWAKKIYRVAQIGFAQCEVFAQQDCAADSRRIAHWEGRVHRDESKKHPTPILTPGGQWLLDKTDNMPVRSWRCVADDD